MLIKRIHCSVCGNTLNATCIGIEDYEITDSSYEIMCHECFLSWEEDDTFAHNSSMYLSSTLLTT